MVSMRLQKFLASCGIASRRKAEELILAGKVTVNGRVVDKLGSQVEPADIVMFNGKELKAAEPVIFAFYKPVGVTSTTSDPHATRTIETYFKGLKVFPVGRLDKYSEGLMLVTNDGELAYELTHPKFEHEKEYEIEIIGRRPGGIAGFKNRFVIDGYKTQPMQLVKSVEVSSTKWHLTLVLKEGRKRQIRMVAEKLGYSVNKLKRTRIGKLTLGTLKPGEYKPIQKSMVI